MPSTRVFSQVLVGLSVLAVVLAKHANADFIEARLILAGNDVTAQFQASVVLSPLKIAGNPASRIECTPGCRCEIGEGMYVVSVDAERLLEAVRPVLMVERSDPAKFQVLKLPVVRTAQLSIPEDKAATVSLLDVLSIESGLIFQQRIDPDHRSMAIPAGDLIVGVRSPSLRPLGFLRLKATPGVSLALPPLPALSRNRGQLFVGFIFEGDGGAASPAALSCLLSIGSEKISPDVAVVSEGVKYLAFWSDIPSGDAEIATISDAWTASSRIRVRIPDRDVVSLPDLTLVAKPTLTLTFHEEDSVAALPVALELLDCAQWVDLLGPPPLALCTSRGAERGTTKESFQFSRLEPSAYAVRWRAGALAGILPVDLRDAKSVSREIIATPIEIEGRVQRGTDNIPAQLTFWHRESGDAAGAWANSSGIYRVLVSTAGAFRVEIQGEGFGAYRENFVVAEADKSVHKDFLIPTNSFKVRVVDAANGRPIEGASVECSWSGTSSDAGIEWTETLATSPEGMAAVRPVGPGTLLVSASARRYRTSSESRESVNERTPGRTIEVRLDKSSGLRLRVVDASGAGIAGATVIPGAQRESQPSGTDGFVVIDDAPPIGSPLVVFSSSGQIATFRLSDADEQVLHLPRFGPPFVVMFRRPDGSPLAGQNAQIAINGIPVAMTLSRALRAGWDPSSKRDGTLRLGGLPAEGELTIWPFGRADLAISRRLGAQGPIEFIIPPAS